MAWRKAADSSEGRIVIQLTTPPDESGISTDSCRALIERITATASFTRSERLSQFLRYAFQKTVDGKLDELSEYQIGLKVFGRSDRYSPGEDSIVRSHARLLRQRLDAYFENEGKWEEIRLSIPKGSYSLHFEHRKQEIVALPQAVVVEEIVLAPEVSPAPSHRKRLWLALVAGLLVVAVLPAFWISRPPSQVDRIWKRVLTGKTRTLIVPADSTLALFEDLTNEVIPLSDYVNHNYHENGAPSLIGNKLWTAGRRYTSMADLQISSRLMRLPQAQGKELVIRYARDLQMADLKGANCVLLGGVRANPWQEVFQDKLNFRIGYDPEHHENRVVNAEPRKGEQASYNESSDLTYHRAYGLIALLPSLSSGTNVVIVQGTSTAGTEAAADFLFDETRFEQFLSQIAPKARGPLFFEAMLQAESVGGNAQRASLIGSRLILPASP